MVYVPRVPPNVVFKTRVRDASINGPNPYRWQDVPASDYFAGKRVVLFALPGAFTPTCSNYQLPGFEDLYPEFINNGIDDIYCLSVNDAFVMSAWARHLAITKVKMIPDGNGEFTKKMGMLVDKSNLGFGMRSWRYAAVIDDGEIEIMFREAGIADNAEDDPYEISKPGKVLEWVKNNPRRIFEN